MTKRIAILAAVLATAAMCPRLAAGPDAPTTRPAATPKAARVRVDRAKRQVVIPAAVQLRQGALEFFLCSKGAKDHETLLVTHVRPATVHAALLALGLMPGRAGRWVTPAGGGEAVFDSARGPRLEIALRWKDAKGKPQEAPASDWLLMAGKKVKPGGLTWVFVGSDFLDDDRYWADVEGMFISLANFPASVIDVPFKSTAEDAFLEFACAAKGIPPQGTTVDVVVTVPEGQEKAPDARINLTVDGFGRIRLDGAAIAAEDLGEAVKKFLAAHARGSADVRLSPRSLAYDRDRLKEVLEEAGLTDITFRTRRLRFEMLPRDPAQAAKAVKWWAEQFAQAEDLIIDPAEDAEKLLKHIEQRRKAVETTAELWADYAARLRALLREHRAKRPPEKTTP